MRKGHQRYRIKQRVMVFLTATAIPQTEKSLSRAVAQYKKDRKGWGRERRGTHNIDTLVSRNTDFRAERTEIYSDDGHGSGASGRGICFK